MTAAADRHLLFGLLALQNGLIDQGQLVAAFQAWTRDKARRLADHLVARGDLDADDRAGRRGAGRAAPEEARRRRREEPGRRPGRPVDPREPGAGSATPTSRRRSATSASGHGSTDDGDADRTASYAVGTATSDGQRFRVLRPHARGGLGAVFVALDARAAPRGGAQADPRPPRRRPGQPPAVPARGRDHRRAGAPRDRPGLRPGHLRRRPAVLRHAVHPGRQPQGGHRALPRRRGARRTTPAGGRWSCASSCGGSPTSATRSTTPTAAGVLHRDIKPGNVIVGKHGETLVVDWGLAKPMGRAEPGADSGERTLVPSSASGTRRDAARHGAGHAGLHEPRAGRGRPGAAGPAVATSTAWARRSTAC